MAGVAARRDWAVMLWWSFARRIFDKGGFDRRVEELRCLFGGCLRVKLTRRRRGCRCRVAGVRDKGPRVGVAGQKPCPIPEKKESAANRRRRASVCGGGGSGARRLVCAQPATRESHPTPRLPAWAVGSAPPGAWWSPWGPWISRGLALGERPPLRRAPLHCPVPCRASAVGLQRRLHLAAECLLLRPSLIMQAPRVAPRPEDGQQTTAKAYRSRASRCGTADLRKEAVWCSIAAGAICGSVDACPSDARMTSARHICSFGIR